MNTTADGVIMNCEVESKDAAALVLEQLRDFESINVISTGGVTDAKNEIGGHVVSFTVQCEYSGLVRQRQAEERERVMTEAKEMATEENAAVGSEE